MSFSVGFSRLTIDPMIGIGISGYFKPRISTGILDSLEANVLALGDGDKTVLLASVDIMKVPTHLATTVREKMAEAAGTFPEAVFLSATHTHTSPYAGYVENGAPEDLTNEYTQYFIRRLTDAARFAVEDMKPARLGFGKGTVPGISFVRRYLMKDGTVGTNPGVNNPNIVRAVGEPDYELNVLRFDREGADTIVLANFGCHPDVIGSTKISADWPGFFRRTFEKTVDNTKAIFFNGCQGEINHVNVAPKGGDMNDLVNDFDDVPRGYGHSRYMGRVVAGACLQVFDKVEYVEAGKLRFATRIVDLPSNMPTPEEIPEAHRIADLHNAGHDDQIPYEGMMLTTVVAEALRMVQYEHGPATIPMPLSVVAFGDFAMVGIAGEPFSPIGVQIKQAKGWKCIMPCCLTNGETGYFPMRDSYEGGGYEARSSEFKAGVGELIIENALDMLKALK